MSWIQQNSNYGKSGGSNTSNSSGYRNQAQTYKQPTQTSYKPPTQTYNQPQHGHRKTATSSYNSNSANSNNANRVKLELQKLRNKLDQMIALL